MIDVLFPIHINRWSNPISSKFREIILNSSVKDIIYHTFSSPVTIEDFQNNNQLWYRSNICKTSLSGLITKKFDIIHRSTATKTNHLVDKIVQWRSLKKTYKIYTIAVEPHHEDPYYNLMKKAVERADYLVANSKIAVETVHEHFNRKVDKVIYNGVDTEFFDPTILNKQTLFKYNIDLPYFVFNSAILPRKRPDLFIEIARKLPNLNFVMVGRPTEFNKTYLGSLPVNVKYLGTVSKAEVRDLMGLAKTLIFTSELEGLPNAVIEAMSLGLPILAQNKSSMPELVKENNGWLVDSDNLDLWIDHVKIIHSTSETEMDQLRKTSRQQTVGLFSWHKYAANHIELYNSLI